MMSKSLTPQGGRTLVAQLEEPKRDSAIVLDGFNPFDAWDRQRITGFLKALQKRGFVERDPSLGGVRTHGPWRSTPQGLKAATRGDFLTSVEISDENGVWRSSGGDCTDESAPTLFKPMEL